MYKNRRAGGPPWLGRKSWNHIWGRDVPFPEDGGAVRRGGQTESLAGFGEACLRILQGVIRPRSYRSAIQRASTREISQQTNSAQRVPSVTSASRSSATCHGGAMAGAQSSNRGRV